MGPPPPRPTADIVSGLVKDLKNDFMENVGIHGGSDLGRTISGKTDKEVGSR